jgi:hypothetical protein
VALSKYFLENFVKYVNSENENEIENLLSYCEENFVNRLAVNLEGIRKFKRDSNSHLKYSINFKNEDTNSNFNSQLPSPPLSLLNKNNLLTSSLKKIQFNVNLYNIKNFIFLGVDPNRKISKNYKFISHIRETIMNNPIGEANPKKYSQNNTIDNSSVRADIISQKINFIPDENLEQIPLCLLSQFEFSLIPSKKLKLNFQIEDTLNEKKISKDLEINSIDFLVESEILRVTMKDMKEIETKIKNNMKKESDEIFEYQNNNNSEYSENSQNAQFFDFLSTSEFENKFKYDLKIIDIENYLNGNEII